MFESRWMQGFASLPSTQWAPLRIQRAPKVKWTEHTSNRSRQSSEASVKSRLLLHSPNLQRGVKLIQYLWAYLMHYVWIFIDSR
jgi:hypothetical protein